MWKRGTLIRWAVVVAGLVAGLPAQQAHAQAKPDLQATKIEFCRASGACSTTFYSNEEIYIKVYVKNVGTQAIANNYGPIWVGLSLNGTSQPKKAVGYFLAIGEEAFASFYFSSLAVGTYICSNTSDPTNTIQELQEGNNSFNKNLTVVNPADTSPPPVPSLSSPGNGSSFALGANIDLSWSAVTDPSGVKYDAQLSTNSSFTNVVKSTSDFLGQIWNVSPTLSAGNYYWRARSRDYAVPPNVSNWSSSRSFTVQGAQTLTVSRVGNGTVTSNPSGISCPSDCSETYGYNTSVTLTATPSAGATFSGWSGDSDCSDGVVTMTGARACTATFGASANTVVQVQNVDGAPRSGAVCRLYNRPGATWVTMGAGFNRTSDAAGNCTWSGLAAASYLVEASYTGTSPFSGEEFWGNLEVSVGAAAQAVTLARSQPYGTEPIEFRLGSSSGALLTSTSTVALGQQIWAGVRIKQQTGFSVSAKARVVLDRNQDATFDLDSGDSTASNVASGATGTLFSFAFTPTATGVYHRALLVKADVNSSYIKTDSWNWYQAFEVVPPANTEILKNLFGTVVSARPVTLFGSSYTVLGLQKAAGGPIVELPFSGPNPAVSDTGLVANAEIARLVLQLASLQRIDIWLSPGDRDDVLLSLAHHFDANHVGDLDDLVQWGRGFGTKRRARRVEVGSWSVFGIREVSTAMVTGGASGFGLLLGGLAEYFDHLALDYPQSALRQEIQALVDVAGFYGAELPTTRAMMVRAGLPNRSAVWEIARMGVEHVEAVEEFDEFRSAAITALKNGDAVEYADSAGKAAKVVKDAAKGLAFDILVDVALQQLGWNELNNEARISTWLTDAHEEAISVLGYRLAAMSNRINDLMTSGSDSASSRAELSRLANEFAFLRGQLFPALVAEAAQVQVHHLRRAQIASPAAGFLGATAENVAIAADEYEDARREYDDGSKTVEYFEYAAKWAIEYQAAIEALGAQHDPRLLVADLAAGTVAASPSGATTTNLSLRLTNAFASALAVNSISGSTTAEGISYVVSGTPTITAGATASMTLAVTVPATWLTTNADTVGRRELPLSVSWTVNGRVMAGVLIVAPIVAPLSQFESLVPDQGIYLPGDTAVITATLKGQTIPNPQVAMTLIDSTSQPRQLSLGSSTATFVLPNGPYGPYGVKAFARITGGNVAVPASYVLRLFYLVPAIKGNLADINLADSKIVYRSTDREAAHDLRAALGLADSSLVALDGMSLAQLTALASASSTVLIGGAVANPLVNVLQGQGRLADTLSNNGDATVAVVTSAFGSRPAVVVAGYRLIDTEVAGIALTRAAREGVPTLSVSDVGTTEGNTGTATAEFTVSLSAESSRTVTVQYATSDHTATVSGNDYSAASGTLTFAPGTVTRSVSVTVKGDTVAEPHETFFLNLASPFNATTLDGQGIGTIVNDDGVQLSVTNVTPNAGSIAGGSTVVIAGTNFAANAAVHFGGLAATGVSVVSATSITATTPAHAAGAVDVVVTNPGGQSATRSDGYTYTVTGRRISGRVIATGTGSGVADARVFAFDSFGQSAGTFLTDSTGVFTSPDLPVSSGYRIAIVDNVGFQDAIYRDVPVARYGRMTLRPGDSYRFATGTMHQYSDGDFYFGFYSDRPQFFANNNNQRGLLSLGDIGPTPLGVIAPPAEGCPTGNPWPARSTPSCYSRFGVDGVVGRTYVSLSRTGDPDAFILMRVLHVQPGVSIDIEYFISTGTPLGTPIVVADGTTTSGIDQLLESVPTIATVTPTHGPGSGGTVVTLTGANFAGAAVFFGGVQSPSVTHIDATRMTAVAPARSGGAVDVEIRRPDGRSAVLPVAYTFDVPAPGSFGKRSPLSGTVTSDDFVPFRWGVNSDVSNYEYCYDTTNDNLCSNWYSAGTAVQPSWTRGSFAPNTPYYWTVRAINTGGMTYADSGTWWTFTVDPSPAVLNRIISLSGNLAFGNVAVGTSATRTLSITNTGNSKLTVGSIAFPVGFTANWLAGVILAGETVNVTVAFSPVVAASYGGTVTVGANHTSGTPTIAASGTGTGTSSSLAQLTTPAPGSKLIAANVRFQWSSGIGATQYRLEAGTSPGVADLFTQTTTNLTATMTGLPINGSSIYVRLGSFLGGSWQYASYTFTASSSYVPWLGLGSAGPLHVSAVSSGQAIDAEFGGQLVMPAMAEVVMPMPGAFLTEPALELHWTAGFGVDRYWLVVGTTPDGAELFNADMGTELFATVAGMPTDGAPVHVRLGSLIHGEWRFYRYVYPTR